MGFFSNKHIFPILYPTAPSSLQLLQAKTSCKNDWLSTLCHQSEPPSRSESWQQQSRRKSRINLPKYLSC